MYSGSSQLINKVIIFHHLLLSCQYHTLFKISDASIDSTLCVSAGVVYCEGATLSSWLSWLSWLLASSFSICACKDTILYMYIVTCTNYITCPLLVSFIGEVTSDIADASSSIISHCWFTNFSRSLFSSTSCTKKLHLYYEWKHNSLTSLNFFSSVIIASFLNNLAASRTLRFTLVVTESFMCSIETSSSAP